MQTPALTFVTDFADQAVILPLVATVALILCAQRRWRVAAAWLLAVSGVLGAILVLKVACYACGWLVPALAPDQLALRSPSGHAASAAVAYGGIAAMLTPWPRLGAASATVAAAMAAIGMAALIGMTRVQLGAHSLSEVMLAGGVGLAGATAFARLAGRHIQARPGRPVLVGALLVLLLFHGRHLPAEQVIQTTGSDALRRWIVACQPE